MNGLGDLQDRVQARLAAFERDRIVERIWERDHTVWRDDPAEIENRLGWLDVAEAMRPRTAELRAFAGHIREQGFTDVVLLGMGGSSLGAETVDRIARTEQGLRFDVLDSTHPAAVKRIETERDLRSTLFVVASKSGTTIETLCHLQYFYGRIQRGTHFAAITDPDTSLAALAESHGFSGVFLNPPDLGGRYSVLSLFGLVPAVLAGADVDALLDEAAAMAARCRSADGPAALLGAAMGEAALAGRDAATFVLPEAMAPLGPWIEQLVAESTGKEGRGILPVVGERPGASPDGRLFVKADPSAAWVPEPFIDVEPGGLGGELFRYELATAIAGHVIDVHPFDQPDVGAAKEATSRVLQQGGASGAGFDDPESVLESKPEYVAILAYLDPSEENATMLDDARASLRDRLGVPVTTGFGPRYLHSTGQLHKGGKPGGAFLIVADDARGDDIAVPGRGFTFGTLLDAQEQGDLQSLKAAGRAVARIPASALRSL